MNYDAVIVLANEMDADGVLNKESSLRADLAAKLVKDLKISYVITCGWDYRSDSKVKIADALKDYLMTLGVLPERIITEINPRDTVGDAVFTRINVVETLGFTKLLVVTSNYHVTRTKKIFDFVYGPDFILDVRGAVVQFSNNILSKELDSEIAFDRTFGDIQIGDIDQIKEVLQIKHPFYNGTIYPKINFN